MRASLNGFNKRHSSVLLATAVLAGVLVFAQARVQAAFEGKMLAKPVELPDFALSDQDGKPFDKARLAGKWSIVFSGYTSCPDICPYTLANVMAAVKSFAAIAPMHTPPRVVFVAVDPDRDRPVLGEYVKYFGDGIIGVTGNVPELETFVKGMGASFRYGRKSAAEDGYMVFHSAQVIVIDPEARVFARMNPPFDPEEAARFLAELIETYKKGS
jgi:protein SCO1/2